MLRFSILLQKALLTALSGFFIWRSAVLLSWLVQRPQPASISTVLIQSIHLDFYLLGIFTVCFAWPIHRIVPDSYYEAVRSESFASVCTFLRIKQFRKLLRLTFWRPWLSKRFFFDGTRSGLARYDQNTRRAESMHTAAFVVILLASLHIGMSGDPLLAVAVFLVNVVWNFYPAILQRYQRSRLRAVRRALVFSGRAVHARNNSALN
jgi:hypothetical protein